MSSEISTDQSLQPWQFFVLAALACATAVTFIVRGEGLSAVILLTILMGAIALVGLAALRTVRPLVSDQADRTAMIGERTRTALEREKMLALRAIKELEFDHAMGKIAPEDFKEMTERLRARAIRLMRQLDAGAGYRERIEKDLVKRLGDATAVRTPEPKARAYAPSSDSAEPKARAYAPSSDSAPSSDARSCVNCSTANDPDAKFCKSCGQPL